MEGVAQDKVEGVAQVEGVSEVQVVAEVIGSEEWYRNRMKVMTLT